MMCTGCSVKMNITEKTLSEYMDNAILYEMELEVPNHYTNNKPFYSYYLPKHIGRRSSTIYSDTLVSNGNEILMSLNASAVISDEFYHTVPFLNTTRIKDALYSEIYNIKDGNNRNMQVGIHVLKFDDVYGLLIRTRYFTFFSQTELTNLPRTVADILKVARATKVNADAVIAGYSNKEGLDYEQTFSIFDQNVSANGTLSEMLEGYYPSYDFNENDENDEFDFGDEVYE